MIIRVKSKLWETRIRPRYEEPPYSYAKKRGLVNTFFPDVTHTCKHYYKHKDKTMITIYMKALPRLYKMNQNQCSHCLNFDRFLRLEREASIICTCCGSSTVDVDRQDGSYTQSLGMSSAIPASTQKLPRVYSSNIYKRCNHFKHWLRRIQGKERNSIKSGDIEQIRSYVQDRNITDLTYHGIQNILRALNMQRYYTHIYTIIKELGGYVMFDLQPVHENRLIERFMQIQDTYCKHTRRANMLGYLYLITKMAELEGWIDMADEIPRFKSEQKLRDADMIWKKICFTLGWEFIQSKPLHI